MYIRLTASVLLDAATGTQITIRRETPSVTWANHDGSVNFVSGNHARAVIAALDDALAEQDRLDKRVSLTPAGREYARECRSVGRGYVAAT